MVSTTTEASHSSPSWAKYLAKSSRLDLQIPAKWVYHKSQCSVCAENSTIYTTFFLRQLQVKCKEQRMSFYVAFIDLTKTFNLISR